MQSRVPDDGLAFADSDCRILDGVMMIIAVFLLSACHPGLVLHERWNDGAFYWSKKSRAAANEKLMSSSSSSRDGQEMRGVQPQK